VLGIFEGVGAWCSMCESSSWENYATSSWYMLHCNSCAPVKCATRCSPFASLTFPWNHTHELNKYPMNFLPWGHPLSSPFAGLTEHSGFAGSVAYVEQAQPFPKDGKQVSKFCIGSWNHWRACSSLMNTKIQQSLTMGYVSLYLMTIWPLSDFPMLPVILYFFFLCVTFLFFPLFISLVFLLLCCYDVLSC